MAPTDPQLPNQELVSLLATSEFFSRLDDPVLLQVTSGLELVQLAPDEILVEQGALDNDLYFVVHGRLVAVADYGSHAARALGEIGPGESAGEMAFLSGQRRTATVVAVEPSNVLRLTKTALDRLAVERPSTVQTFEQALWAQVRRRQLHTALRATHIFGALDPALLCDLEAELEWIALPSGETLIRQGEPGDCLYVVISGRLRVVKEQAGVEERVLREVGRGESIGEMALITGEKRAATVYAIRDSEVVRLAQAGFAQLLAKHPHAMTATFTRSLVESLTRQLAGEKPGINTLTAVAIIPVDQAVLLAEFTHRLVNALAAIGPTLHLSSARIDGYLGKPGIAQTDGGEGEVTEAQVVAWLSEQESKHRCIIYEADPAPTAWSRRCLRQADHILIVGHATADPAIGELEKVLVGSVNNRGRKRQSLVLLHRADPHRPWGTERWLAVRQVEQHVHVRWQNKADFGRLARYVAGCSIGLVLGGGAARGFAHIGVIRALEEAGMPIDMVGGTSIGALIAAQYAMGWSVEEIMQTNRSSETAAIYDYTIPLVSLMAGHRMADIIKKMFGGIHIQDLWLPYFCVSTNLTKANVMIHTAGLLWRGLRASNSLPGLLPPLIHNGDALVDGGLLDNVPVDIMRDRCRNGPVIAVDVAPSIDLAKIAPYGESLSGWQVLQSKINPFSAALNVPSLMALLYRTVEIGGIYDQRTTHKHELADLYLRPPVQEFSLLDYRAIDKLAEIGYQYAHAMLTRWQADGKAGEGT